MSSLPRWVWRAGLLLVVVGGLVAVAVVRYAPQERMLGHLDRLELPDDVVLISEEVGGPPHCFAASCPIVERRYATGRPAAEVCPQVQAAVEAWGVREASWRVGESEFNPCTGFARRGRYDVSVAVAPFERRVTVLPGRDEAPPDARETTVIITLRVPLG